MFLTKRPNGFYYVVYDNGGRRRFVSTKTRQKSAANAFLKVFDKNKQKSGDGQSVRLSDFMNLYRTHSEAHHRPNTTRTAMSSLRELSRFLGNAVLKDISPLQMDAFLTAKSSECNVFTLRKYFVTLKSVFSTAARWNMISSNPLSSVPKPKTPERLPVFFSREQFSALLSAVSDNDFKELVLFGVMTGMRVSEIVNLTWQDVDLDRQMVHIRNSASFQTKSGKNRAVPMNEQLHRLLSVKVLHKTGELVFPRRDGGLFRSEYISKQFKKYVLKAGLAGELHFHSLRATYASWLVQAGVSLFQVQKLLGHSDSRTSMIYASLQPEAMHNVVNVLSIQ